MKAGKTLWIIKQSKVVNTCPTSQALSIHTVGTIAPVSLRAVKITSMKTGVTKHREIRGLRSCWWSFVNVTILYPSTSTHHHSVSDLSRDCFKDVYFSRSWTNVARPCFLLKESPASAKLKSVNFFEEVKWVSCNRMTRASCCTARW